MTKSLSHTRADRAVDQFLRQSRLGRQLGFSHQLIEDHEFHGDTITIGGRELVNFGLCCYLGLGDDPRVVEAAIDAVTRYGNSYSSSVAYTALPLYGDLRERLGAMLDAPVVVAASTSLAHFAALPVMVRRGDVVIVDALAHASILAVLPTLEANGAEVRQVPHNDLARVSDLAAAATQRSWYLIDGLYSMAGDTAPAEELMLLFSTHPGLWVYCDDAHGFGWDGARGQGQFLRRAGWHDRLVMSFGLAKSFGTMGGVIAARDEDLIEAIEVTGGPMVFGGPLPPPVLGASIVAADIHLSDELPGLQAELMERIRFVAEHSSRIGLPLGSKELTPLWWVEIGPVMSTASVVSSLLNEGFFVNGAVFPAVPRGRGGVRFTVTRYNSLAQIESMLDLLNEARLEQAGHDDIIDLTALEDPETESSAQGDH
ncbi:MAG TPA: aminotransferase class I/II-fold pyridoxal phosphate-dependent enzyme [Acidimicrobiia bacterium]|nr:aminotransferase class I/II-fold pyridoxal phosphate-dependent enzyme [Acidimicrobiia bacterium]